MAWYHEGELKTICEDPVLFTQYNPRPRATNYTGNVHYGIILHSKSQDIFHENTALKPMHCIQWNISNLDTNGAEESILFSELCLFHARVLIGAGKGVTFREVSSV